MPCANTPVMQIFLDKFAERIAPDEHVAPASLAVIVLDQAGGRHQGALRARKHHAGAAAGLRA